MVATGERPLRSLKGTWPRGQSLPAHQGRHQSKGGAPWRKRTANPVDRVFLTGGTSLVPAVRRLFEERFGPHRVAAGGEFVSVAEGLALIAGEVG